MASFLFRPETAFASLVPLRIHIYSVSESHLIFCCLVSSICLAPLGKDCLSMHTVSSWNSSDLSPQRGFCGLAKGIDSSFLTHWRMACSAPAGYLGPQGFLPQEELPLYFALAARQQVLCACSLPCRATAPLGFRGD